MSVSSLSLAEARELWVVLTECEQKLDRVEAKAKTTAMGYRDLYNVMQDVFVVLRHAGLPEEHVATLAFMQRMITTAYSLIIAVNALNAAMAASPAGWAIAGLGFAATLLSSISMVGSFG